MDMDMDSHFDLDFRIIVYYRQGSMLDTRYRR